MRLGEQIAVNAAANPRSKSTTMMNRNDRIHKQNSFSSNKPVMDSSSCSRAYNGGNCRLLRTSYIFLSCTLFIISFFVKLFYLSGSWIFSGRNCRRWSEKCDSTQDQVLSFLERTKPPNMSPIATKRRRVDCTAWALPAFQETPVSCPGIIDPAAT